MKTLIYTGGIPLQEKLKTLYEQMENELRHLNQTEKAVVRRYMMWAFERGESDIFDKIKSR